MTIRKVWLVSLMLAAVLQCGLASFHFALPHVMDWGHANGMEILAERIVWALYVLNFSWSLLVLVTGSLVVYAAVIGPPASRFTRHVLLAIGLFWAIHASYQALYPMPLPSRLLWLQVLLPTLPAALAVLLWIPLVFCGEGRKARHAVPVRVLQ